jgi:hypothetical protein
MFFRLRSNLSIVGIACVATLALVAGCDVGADDEGSLVRPEGNSSLAEARAFERFPLYFAGSAAGGFRLEAVQRTDRTSPARYTEFAFLYGSCRAAGDRGCGVPLTILLWPACNRYEQRYSIPARERVTVRGVPGRLSQDSRRLELYPARATIVINGHGLESRAALLAVARALRGVNTLLPAASPLPARPAHAGRTLRCR